MILQIYAIIQTLISLVAIFTSFVISIRNACHRARPRLISVSLGSNTLFTVSKQTTKQRKEIL